MLFFSALYFLLKQFEEYVLPGRCVGREEGLSSFIQQKMGCVLTTCQAPVLQSE